MRLLFVCLGNICRSPAAEAVTRNVARTRGIELTLDSAGTGTWHLGEPPYGPMQSAARARGIDMSDLRARLFGAGDFGAFDLILAMDDQNLADIEALRPRGNTTPVRMFLGEASVPDPYYTRRFDAVLDLIEDGAARLVDEITD